MTAPAHDCCLEAALHLAQVEGKFRFVTAPQTQEGLAVKFCPWCGDRLADGSALLHRRRSDPLKLRD